MSERFTVRLDEEAAEWVAAEADARDRSKAWIIQEAVDAARGTDSVFTDAGRTEAVRSGAHLTDRLDALEERLADLETGRDEPSTETAEDRATDSADSAASDPPTTASAEPTDDVTGQPAAERAPPEQSPPSSVEEALAAWEPGRDVDTELARTEVGRAAAWLHETGQPAKRSTLVDALAGDSPIGERSWWERAVRPGLKALAEAGLVEFNSRQKDYRWIGDGGTAEDGDTSGVYDPTEEF